MAAREGCYPRYPPCKRSCLGSVPIETTEETSKLGACQGVSPAPHSQILPVRNLALSPASAKYLSQTWRRGGGRVGLDSSKLLGDLSS